MNDRTYGHVAIDKGMLGIKTEPHVVLRLKRIFPRIQQEASGWLMVKATDEVCAEIAWCLSRWPMILSDRAQIHIDQGVLSYEQRQEDTLRILDGSLVLAGDHDPARAFRPHQISASDLCLRSGRLLVADGLGAGKTSTALALLRSRHAFPMMVVTLTHLPRQWQNEINTVWPGLRTHILRKVTPYSLDRICDGKPPQVIITSYSKIVGWGNELEGEVASIVFDEAQELRRHQTQRYVNAAILARSARYRMELTATPVYNYGGEAFSVLDVIAPEELGTREEFVREWGTTTQAGHVVIKDPKALGTYLRDAGLMVRRPPQETGLSGTEPTRIRHVVDTDPKALAALSGDLAALAARIVARASEDASEQRHLRGQFDMRLRQVTGIAKAPYVAEFVKLLLESEAKVIVFAWHREVYSILMEKLAEYEPVLYTGSETPAAKEKAKDAFTKGQSRVLLISLRSGAGLDGLQQVCNVVAFAELDWSPEVMAQCVGRVDRPGQEFPVLAYYLVSEGTDTSDPKIEDVLEIKTQQADPIKDPTLAITRKIDVDQDKIYELAQQYLKGQR